MDSDECWTSHYWVSKPSGWQPIELVEPGVNALDMPQWGAVAMDVAVSLRYATATLTKNTRNDDGADATCPSADDPAPVGMDPAAAPGDERARTTARGREREFSVVGSD